MGQEDKNTKSNHAHFWRGILTLVALVIAYSLYSGVSLKKIEVPDIFVAEFAPSGESHDNHALTPSGSSQPAANIPHPVVPESELPAVSSTPSPVTVMTSPQPAAPVVAKSRHIPHDVVASAEHTSTADVVAANLSGVWFSNEGLQYNISQQGNRVSLQEINPLLGGMITAEGEGEIDGREIDMQLSTLLGITGYAELEVSVDGQRIHGSYTATGSFDSMPLQLFRQN